MKSELPNHIIISNQTQTDEIDFINNKIKYFFDRIRFEIASGTKNSRICKIIYKYVFDLFDNENYDSIKTLLDDIDLNEFNTTILFGFLSAINFQKDKIVNFNIFLEKFKNKIKTEYNYNEKEMSELFYGVE